MVISEFVPSECDFVIVNEDGDYVDLGRPMSHKVEADYFLNSLEIDATFAIPMSSGKTGAVGRLFDKCLRNSCFRPFMGSMPHADKVILHDPAVVVYWQDGTKTVAKAQNEKYDPEKGLAMCFVKKMLDVNGMTLTAFNKLLKESDAK